MNPSVGRIVIFLLFILTTRIQGQNLCPNPGFEQLSGCPTGQGEIDLAYPWTDAGSPADLFSFCHVNSFPPQCSNVGVPDNFAGHSAAHGGSVFAGFYTKKNTANHRTYVQATLLSPLLNGQLYKVTAFFRRSSNSKYATNRIGVAFATAPLAQAGSSNIPLTPQGELTSVVADTGNWTPFTCYYVGTGLEDQVVFGNFRNDVNTTAFNFSVTAPACSTMDNAAFYFIDDISVTTFTEQLSVTGDTMLCTGETTSITGITNTTGWWSLQSTPNDTFPSSNNTISVSPVTSTTYLWHGVYTTYTVTVSVSTPPVVSLPADTTLCEGETILLDATNPNSTYLWSEGSTTNQLAVTDSGKYIVTVNNGYCNVRDTFLLEIIDTPELNLGSDALLCPDNYETITLNAGSGDSYIWSPGGETSMTLVVTEPGYYTVVVSHMGGCTKTDSITVTEHCRETLYVPGAFTPNNDNKNDLFYADGTNIHQYKIIIFNRWGQPVFNSSSLGRTGAWDGKQNQKAVAPGLYTYMINYEVLQSNGKTKRESKSGYFMLFR